MTPDLKPHGSLYNRIASPLSDPLPKIVLQDLTLQGDAEEMAGVSILEADKIAIATLLSQLGVDRLAVLGNSPSPAAQEIKIVEKIVGLGLPVQLGSFLRTESEIDIAARIGLWGVTVLVYANDRLLPPGMSGQSLIDEAKRLTAYAKNKGLFTCFMGVDSTRTRPEFLLQLITEVDQSGSVDEFVIADSLGVVSPYGMQYLIEQVKQWTNRPLHVHCHNHSSMAMANALASIVGGASVIHATMNGVGEFSGLLPLEEFAVALPMHLGISLDLRLEMLKEISDRVVKATGVPISPQKPVVGDRAFCVPEGEDIQQSFLSADEQGILDQSLTYPPEYVGNQLIIAIGRKCNAATVRFNLRNRGLTTDEENIPAIVALVQEAMAKVAGYQLMSEDEFFSLIKTANIELYPLNSNSKSSVRIPATIG